MGWKDVLKVIQLLPGVQKGEEGNSGLYFRGRGPYQNLIILDDAPVYNAFHLFGFFSLFNGDALKSVELIKGGFPALRHHIKLRVQTTYHTFTPSAVVVKSNNFGLGFEVNEICTASVLITVYSGDLRNK